MYNKIALVVDDEEIIRELLEKILNRLGYNVILAENGAEAVDIYTRRQDKIDLAIIDMIMPGINGDETAAWIRSVGKDVAIILTSGQRPKAEDQHASRADGFLAKPFRVNTLSELIKMAERRRLTIARKTETYEAPTTVFSVIS